MIGYLSLGGNVGDARANLRKALQALDETPGVEVLRVSRCYLTEPVGELNQPVFRNLAAEIKTGLAPLELLNAVKRIEQAMGRAPGPRWGPRLIDIDIILMDDTVFETPELTVPHARFRERAFVLAPLAELAADAVDPVTGLTVLALAARPEVIGRVEIDDEIDS
ncbi:MAG: 2-amino-4-hydroxy-6-hydroxymethyldihydropteridine diphosphokinase [Candidatus Hydrogenedens sp.]|nr:2-amino-4-hydroxy-6-hydroxymethyldihydropteridine diphosphokinase [Candidatus Hydrogenedens sp.]